MSTRVYMLGRDEVAKIVNACQTVIDALRTLDPDDAEGPTPREAVAYWFKIRKWLDWDKPAYRADEHRAECHAQVRAWTAIARRQDST
jgi:broad specificity phosphatase PhoE